jgi:hypothetical protein
MNCPQCGGANPDGKRFCGDCGAALATSVSAPAPQTREETAAPPVSAGERRQLSGAGNDGARSPVVSTLSNQELEPRMRQRFLIAVLLYLVVGSAARAMERRVVGDQLILSGPVIASDYDAIASLLSSQPEIKTVILRNSPGGDAPTGYHLGELFRQKSLQTAVSGYCYSSCSRLFLGGKERQFTDDYPPQYTHIGFHGHYDRNGDLNWASVSTLHLRDWIMRFSDGKADIPLVERWIRIPRGAGMIHFYNPESVNIDGYSTFMCQGTEPNPRVFDCEHVGKNALDLGIVTSPALVRSHNQ